MVAYDVDQVPCRSLASPVGGGGVVDQREEVLRTDRPLVEPEQRPAAAAVSAVGAGAAAAGLGRAPCEDGMVVGRAGGVGEAAAEHELRNELVEVALPSAHS